MGTERLVFFCRGAATWAFCGKEANSGHKKHNCLSVLDPGCISVCRGCSPNRIGIAPEKKTTGGFVWVGLPDVGCVSSTGEAMSVGRLVDGWLVGFDSNTPRSRRISKH